jgi:hypothetical protein
LVARTKMLLNCMKRFQNNFCWLVYWARI